MFDPHLSDGTRPTRSIRRHCKTFFFREDQLSALTEAYRTGQKELSQICEEVTDQMGLLIHPGEQIVTDYWDDHYIQWHRSHSHSEKVVPPVVEDAILRLSHGLLKRGIQKMHATLLLPEYDTIGPVSVTDVQKIFEQHNLWTGERKPKVKVPQRCRYEGDYVNLIWHTDHHHFHHGYWIIAWIDDRSRMCLRFGFSRTRSLRKP
jgi:hypothetical protein